MIGREFLEADEDPEEAVAVFLELAWAPPWQPGQRKVRGDREYALACLSQALERGVYPRGWEPRR
jgi:hypothetical protein